VKREHSKDEIRKAVRERYAGAAREAAGGACPCCGGAETHSREMGYTAEDIASLPAGADLGLGCGNPRAIAALRSGEVVLDLGSGGGIDCFLAAAAVGPGGRVIGVDMTPEMISRARANAEKSGHSNVEFRLGEIEHLPVADASVDVVVSNCVINLSPDKPGVLTEAFRVLKPGGRLAVSDVVATAPIPKEVRDDLACYSSCVAGAVTKDDYERLLNAAGFVGVKVEPRAESRALIEEWSQNHSVAEYVLAAHITAEKPAK
jgi:arsenite methyltransferase